MAGGFTVKPSAKRPAILGVVVGFGYIYQPVVKLWHRRLAGGFHGQERRFRIAVFLSPRADIPLFCND